MREGTYFTIPPKLLEFAVQGVGKEHFDTDGLRRELELGRAASMDYGNVGFHRGAPIAYQFLLTPPPMDFDPELLAQAAREWGLSQDKLSGAIDEGAERLDALHHPQRGYVGWLLTTPTFLDEHDELIRTHGSPLQEDGIPQPLWGSSGRDRVERDDPWVMEFRTFCERWRLQTLAAPSLPIPLEPQIPALVPSHPAPPGTVTVFFPDTSPTLARGVLDEALEDALHTSPPEHLGEWIALVSKDTRTKTQIAAYERRFCLQHFWRLLHARFPEPLRRKKTILRDVFADFLAVSDDSIKDVFATSRNAWTQVGLNARS